MNARPRYTHAIIDANNPRLPNGDYRLIKQFCSRSTARDCAYAYHPRDRAANNWIILERVGDNWKEVERFGYLSVLRDGDSLDSPNYPQIHTSSFKSATSF